MIDDGADAVRLPAPHVRATGERAHGLGKEIEDQLDGGVRGERMRHLTAHPWLN